MNVPSFTQIWMAFKAFSSKSVLKVGNGFKFFLSLIASILFAYGLYSYYDIPIRDVQVYVHEIYGLNHPYDIDLSINMDYGGGVTSSYKNNYKKGVVLNLSNSYNWDYKDKSVFGLKPNVTYLQGNHIIRHVHYPAENILRTLQEELPSDTSFSNVIKVLFAAHVIESKLPRYYYNYSLDYKGYSGIQTKYQRHYLPDSIVDSRLAYHCILSEGYDSVFNHECLTSTSYIANTDPCVNFSYVLPTSKSLYESKIFSPYDLSQCYYHLTLDITDCSDNSSLSLDFGGATEFSHMDPEPDKITMSSVIFTDSLKLEKIGKEGLWMHAKFKQLENIQIIRMFVITTGLGFFIALLFSSGWKWLSHRCRRYVIREKRKRSNVE